MVNILVSRCSFKGRKNPLIMKYNVISLEDDEVLWGGGIMRHQDVSRYAAVVGVNVEYIEKSEEKSGWEIGRLLIALNTEKRRGQYALFENANIGNKSAFLATPTPCSKLPVGSPIRDSRGSLIDIVPTLEEADRILFERIQKFVKGGFFDVRPEVPIKRISRPDWVNQFF